MSYALKDLEAAEVSWLKRLADGRVHVVPTAMAERLQSLGLAQKASPDLEDPAISEQEQGSPGTRILGTRINDDGLRLLDEEE
ncbi:hypothetical protein [Mycoplana rhizolycopersici]|jgi:hypothetical protein|uniref:Uncharacterized protein n=1 Tax=Mycoplana rhizolycopersici TaxID=2746702 RepID=A0ABX2QQB4_9HYPH|nr:hypothetical protein [Rhizobium rhizolycopersici]NVP58516.1 hypothetical protein [Rhizobium rhizolycopersici]